MMINKEGKRLGFEFNYADAPTFTRSMQIAMTDLELHRLTVIHPGKAEYMLKKDIRVVGLEKYLGNMFY